MEKVLFGVVALPLLFGIALAEMPKQSNDNKASANTNNNGITGSMVEP